MAPWIPVGVTVVIGVLTLWYIKRRDVISADRVVLDDIRREMVEYYERIEAARRQLPIESSTVPRMRALAIDVDGSWNSLERGWSHVGRLSRLRYDGIRTLAHRIGDSCNSTARDREQLKALAQGTAVTSPERLTGAIPWPALNADALIYLALASIYRREGPLGPITRAWWRVPSRRESTDQQITAPIRHRGKRKKGETTDDVRSIARVREIIRALPEFNDLSDSGVNELAYRVLHDPSSDEAQS